MLSLFFLITRSTRLRFLYSNNLKIITIRFELYCGIFTALYLTNTLIKGRFWTIVIFPCGSILCDSCQWIYMRVWCLFLCNSRLILRYYHKGSVGFYWFRLWLFRNRLLALQWHNKALKRADSNKPTFLLLLWRKKGIKAIGTLYYGPRETVVKPLARYSVNRLFVVVGPISCFEREKERREIVIRFGVGDKKVVGWKGRCSSYNHCWLL